MTEKEAEQLWIHGEPMAPTLARHFIEWLYENGYMILSPDEIKKVNQAIVIADIHGMNPFSKK